MKKAMQLITVLGLAMSVSGAARADLVVNGSFETTSTPGVNGQLGQNGFVVNGWTVPAGQANSYAYIFKSGTATNTGSVSDGGQTLKLAGNPSSPDGGNFLAADGDPNYRPGKISQTLTGLTAGKSYTLTFNWAAGQQLGSYNQATTSQWDVFFGGAQQNTNTLTAPIQGVSGWETTSMIFTADASTDVLSFLAVGGPSGEPPFSLLDNVSVNATTPEGSSLGLLSMGLLSMGGFSLFVRRAKAAKSAA